MKNNKISRQLFNNLTGILLMLSLSISTVLGQINTDGESPINIETSSLNFVPNLPRLNFNYQNGTPLGVINTGSPDEFASVRANVPLGAGVLTVGGVAYNLVQFHWHTDSEHLINDRGFPLEMHLVHQAADGSLLVVGVFVKRGRQNQELEKIFSQLPPTPANTASVNSFDLPLLLPRFRQSFRYTGSLTAPPFTRGVNWVVLAQPIEMSGNQIRAYRRIFPEGNSRETQPLNGRIVRTDLPFFHY